jgi:diguanylate cyclase (GGDEF)-like protein/PAS domain S-box-containing protein
MSTDKSAMSDAADKEKEKQKEVAALIATLHEAERRLEELTGGEVDAVLGRDGTPFLLRRAQAELRLHEAAKQAAILNALPAHIALIDNLGVIVSFNHAWQQFAEINGLPMPGYGAGINYLEACDKSREGRAAAAGIRAVLAGESNRFSIEYPCHSPTQQRWFQMTVTPSSPAIKNGAVIMHLDITDRTQAEHSLRASRQRLDGIVSSAMDGIITVDADSRIVVVNPAAEKIFGYTAAELLDQPVEILMPVKFRAGHGALLAAFGTSGSTKRRMGKFNSVFGLRKNGETFPLEVTISHDDSFKQNFFTAALRDVTERLASEQKIQHLNRVYAVLSDITMLIVQTLDRDELFSSACRIAVETGGFRMAMICIVDRVTNKLTPVASAGADEAFLTVMRHHLSSAEDDATTMRATALRDKAAVVSNNSQDDLRLELRENYTRAGVRSLVMLPLIVSGEAVGILTLYAGEPDFFYEEEMKLLTGLADDIALAINYIDKQTRLDHLKSFDTLTDLANRRLWLERLSQYALGAANNGHRLALVLIDLERFKNINDTLGQPAGDTLLQQVAQWLTQHLDDVNKVARVGANQFAIVLPEEQRPGDALRQLEAMIEAFLLHPFSLKGDVYRIAAKFGVAMFPDDGSDAAILFKNAEAALKKAKVGGHRYLLYTQQMTETVAQRLNLENQLRQALDKNEFVLHYQPKVNLHSGEITGVEALIRWNDPQTGLVPPDMFIPILEETGLIYDVGLWALQQALRDYLRWRDAGLHAVRIAVNVSPLQMRHPRFIAMIEQIVASDSRAGQGLELEITEGMIMADMPQAISSLQAIRALGISIAIDDFGTGFSSLGYLSKLPIDTLKIDRMFITDMATDQQGLSLVSTIITLAHSLQLKVVAEGVETEEQSHLLRLLKCDEMQGFLFSKPLAVAALQEKFLARLAQSR